jgi:hypothetical protein
MGYIIFNAPVVFDHSSEGKQFVLVLVDLRRHAKH